MVIDLKKNIVYVYFHMNEGEISPKIKVLKNDVYNVMQEYPRENMLGFAKLSETGGEKKMDDPLVT